MKNNTETKIWNATLYLRLSRDDGDKEESNSITGQRELLRDFIRNRPELREYAVRIDDGFTGSNFERPDFKKMMEDVKEGRTNCIIVKDLSRFGRNYLDAGEYIEKIFPFLGVRFIAVNDNYDSLGEKSASDDLVIPFKNLINEAYCRDISVKVRTQLEIKRKSGQYIGAFAVYGYMKDDTDKNRLVVDEYAADIVRDIFAWKLDGMSPQDIAVRLNQSGIRFIAVNDGFDTLTAERGADGYLVPLKNLINEVYSKDISKKSGSALATKQKNGDFIGAWAPYGYRKCADDPHKLEPDEATAPVVRQIFQWRVDGMSVTRIAKKLNDSGIPSPSAYLYNTGVCKTEKYNGAVWHIQAVKIILTRQVYIGHMVQGTKRQSFYESRKQYKKPQEEWVIVENTHEPIIDRDTFEKVQEIMRQRNEEYFEKLGRFSYLETTENILKGLIYCADCKRPLVRYKNVSHNKKLWYTFICQTHSNDITSCPKKNIREDALIPMLMQAIQTQIELAADMDELVRRVNSSPKHRKRTADLQGRLDSAKKTLKRYNNLYDSLYQNYVDKLMTEQEYITLKSRYRAEAEEAERLIEALTRQQAEESEHTPENRFLTAFGSFKGEDTLTKEMAQALIERVYVDGSSNIEIVFRYRDEYRALCTYLEGKENGA